MTTSLFSCSHCDASSCRLIILTVVILQSLNSAIRSFSIPMKYYNLTSPYPFHVVVEPENKLVFLTSVGVPANYEAMFLKEGKMSVKLLDEKLRMEYQVFSMRKFTPFFEEFKNKIERLIEMGFQPKHLMGDFESFKSQHEGIDDGVPALVLNMEDLEIGFLVCMIPLVLKVIVFVCELMATRISALTDLLTCLYLIRNMISSRIGLK